MDAIEENVQFIQHKVIAWNLYTILPSDTRHYAECPIVLVAFKYIYLRKRLRKLYSQQQPPHQQRSNNTKNKK